jgi:amidase
MAVSGPIGRTIADLRIGLAAMAAPDPRDPWWTPTPFVGGPVQLRAAFCLRPSGLSIATEVEAAVLDAARRLSDAGWEVEELEDTPSLQEASELQVRLWIGDGFSELVDAVERDGDPGARAVVAAFRAKAEEFPPDLVARTLIRRATLTRDWRMLLSKYPVLLLPVSAELPFTVDLDLKDDASFRRVWQAQMTQTGLPVLGLPVLAVSTGMVGSIPVGVQVVADRYREDLCLQAGEVIEAGGVPVSPIDLAVN